MMTRIDTDAGSYAAQNIYRHVTRSTEVYKIIMDKGMMYNITVYIVCLMKLKT